MAVGGVPCLSLAFVLADGVVNMPTIYEKKTVCVGIKQNFQTFQKFVIFCQKHDFLHLFFRFNYCLFSFNYCAEISNKATGSCTLDF